MRIKKIIAVLLCSALIFTGCSSADTTNDSNTAESTDTTGSTTAENVSKTVTTTDGIDVDLVGNYSDNALDATYDEDEATKISLDDDSISVDGDGATVDGTTVTITEKGTYIVSGTLADGQIVVDLTADQNVQLVLDNADITCSDGSAIVVWNAKNLYLTLAEGSSNTVTDGAMHADEDEANAAIYSKSDLILNGTGSLTVNANYKDGITSKDDLQIIEGTITVNAVDDAIIGKDSISVKDGTINLTAGGDALKSSNTEDTAKGYVIIDGGTFTIKAGDDGIHSETVLVVNAGTINVESSVEGLESLNIIINDGTIDVTSSDDGVNIAGGNDTTSIDSPTGGGMGGGMDTVIDGALVIKGGTFTIDAEGDGLDSNGNILMTGGTVTVSGPTNSGNAALDFNGTFEMDGGILLTSGTSGMAQSPSDESAQESIVGTFSSTISGGTEITIKDADKNTLYTFTVVKNFNSVIVSVPEIVADETYTIEAGGESVEVTGGDTSTATGDMGGGQGGGQGGMGNDMGGSRDDMKGTMPEQDSSEMQQNPDSTTSDGTTL